MARIESIFILLGCAWCALAVHEAGHLIAGRIMGFRFGFFAIGPLWLAREGQRLRIRWNRLPAAWGGMALAYPTDSRALARRLAFYAGGGPLANLVLSVAAFSLVYSLPPHTFQSRCAMGLAILSAAVFVATAQPFGTGTGVPSDGGRVLRFVMDRAEAQAEAVYAALEGLAAAGVRPREWDAELLRAAEGIRYPAATALCATTLVLRHRLDQRDLAKADAVVDSLLGAYDTCPRMLRGDAAAELAFYLSFFRRDAMMARRFLKDADSPLTEKHRILRAEAAVLLRSADIPGAIRALERAEVALSHPLVEASDLDRDLIASVGRELDGSGAGRGPQSGNKEGGSA